MPTYEYECGHCRHRFEMKQSFDDEPVALCPECRSGARRVFYPTAIVFKGSGFYITDSRKSGGGEVKEAKKEAAKTEGKQKEAAKTEGKQKEAV